MFIRSYFEVFVTLMTAYVNIEKWRQFFLLKEKVKYLTIKIKRQRFASLQSIVRKKVQILLVDNKVKEKEDFFYIHTCCDKT